jgi:hypothetical protein
VAPWTGGLQPCRERATCADGVRCRYYNAGIRRRRGGGRLMVALIVMAAALPIVFTLLAFVH